MALNIFRKGQSQPAALWHRSWSDLGVTLHRDAGGAPLVHPLLPGFLEHLRDDGFATESEDESVHLPWDALFAALQQPGYEGLADALRLPPFSGLRPVLSSANALTDEDFSIAIDGWVDDGGRRHTLPLTGPVLAAGEREMLLDARSWRLVSAVREFARRPQDSRDDTNHRLAWGRIRRLAIEAGAHLDDFLHRSVVLTPERLQIELRKGDVAGDSVIEVSPLFEGAPPDWLERFDAMPKVPERYDIVTPEGIVQVLVSSKVRTVLEEIKRMPGRRMAGPRAQAFIVNPGAALGADAGDVIDEKQFEEARAAAGVSLERFLPVIERSSTGAIERVGLLIEAATVNGTTHSEHCWFSPDSLDQFIRKLYAALERDFPLLGWEGFDLELQGDAEKHAEALSEALKEWMASQLLITYEQVHDLSAYSARIEGIGQEKAIYSPYIASKARDWFPENVVLLVAFTPEGQTEPVALPVGEDQVAKLRESVIQAEASGAKAVTAPGLPTPVPLPDARRIVAAFDKVIPDVRDRTFTPKPEPVGDARKPTPKQLILRSNIQVLEYEERRKAALESDPGEPSLPSGLRPDFPLLPHQREGVAWLQHLYRAQQEFHVRGAVLADDMGLGKTFQLLTFMAWLEESHPDIDPMLVVAPVSLLENWKQEKEKFLSPETLPILTAYGDALADLRVPREAIDHRLRTDDGLVRFLKPGWTGHAKLVLTTYETLRDLEFSFSSQRWSVMVCDEAQRIKNPGAMVTRAAKKQNASFRIACTGTPVENTLADLWCLFDFVQPGLLGALDEFGRRYRKPIEANTDEEKARVEELRARISPQILRRTKADVAKDLPQKIVAPECRNLRLSPTQYRLYSQAVESFRRRGTNETLSPFKNHLGLLHYLRLICTDPSPRGAPEPAPQPLADYRTQSPKMHWLMGCLESIRRKNEKAIVFCEFRDIQRLLQHYIHEVFEFSPAIINGDTSASESSADSRQKQIRKFQDKPGFGVIILSPVAVGFGVNIQAANHVIHFTRTWNPAKEDQATDRAYRIGQTRDVYVHYPIVRGSGFRTFDEVLDELLEKKRELAKDMLNGAGDVMGQEFAIDGVSAPDSVL
jgi:hypothetical protein